MANLDEVISNIKSCIVSRKGLPISKLNDAYTEKQGRSIPFQEMGFESVEDLLTNIPEVYTRKYRGKEILKVLDESSDHLAILVGSGSRTPKKKPKRSLPVPLRRFSRFKYSIDDPARNLYPNSKHTQVLRMLRPYKDYTSEYEYQCHSSSSSTSDEDIPDYEDYLIRDKRTGKLTEEFDWVKYFQSLQQKMKVSQEEEAATAAKVASEADRIGEKAKKSPSVYGECSKSCSVTVDTKERDCEKVNQDKMDNKTPLIYGESLKPCGTTPKAKNLDFGKVQDKEKIKKSPSVYGESSKSVSVTPKDKKPDSGKVHENKGKSKESAPFYEETSKSSSVTSKAKLLDSPIGNQHKKIKTCQSEVTADTISSSKPAKEIVAPEKTELTTGTSSSQLAEVKQPLIKYQSFSGEDLCLLRTKHWERAREIKKSISSDCATQNPAAITGTEQVGTSNKETTGQYPDMTEKGNILEGGNIPPVENGTDKVPGEHGGGDDKVTLDLTDVSDSSDDPDWMEVEEIIKHPIIGKHELVGDDLLLDFVEKTFQGKVELKNLESWRAGLCMTGLTVSECTRWIRRDAPRLALNIAVFVGSIDFSEGSRYSDVKEEMIKLLDVLEEESFNVTLLTLPPQPQMRNINLDIQAYNRWLKILPKTRNVNVVDICPIFATINNKYVPTLYERNLARHSLLLWSLRGCRKLHCYLEKIL